MTHERGGASANSRKWPNSLLVRKGTFLVWCPQSHFWAFSDFPVRLDRLFSSCLARKRFKNHHFWIESVWAFFCQILPAAQDWDPVKKSKVAKKSFLGTFGVCGGSKSLIQVDLAHQNNFQSNRKSNLKGHFWPLKIQTDSQPRAGARFDKNESIPGDVQKKWSLKRFRAKTSRLSDLDTRESLKVPKSDFLVTALV